MKTATLWRSLGAFLPAIFLLNTATVSAQAPGTAYETAAPATITVTSEWPGGGPNNGPAANVIDGDFSTAWNSGGTLSASTAGPATVTVTFDSPRIFSGLNITAHAAPAETMHYTVTATRSDNSTVVVNANFALALYPALSSQEFDLGLGFVEYTSVQIDIGGITGWKAINEVELIVPVAPVNTAPDVSAAVSNPGSLWPPNKKMVDIAIDGIVDVEGDAVTINIDAITNNETGTDDASGVGTSTASVRADRDGRGDGRVYTIDFTATDAEGASTSGSVTVVVPHDQGDDDDHEEGYARHEDDEDEDDRGDDDHGDDHGDDDSKSKSKGKSHDDHGSKEKGKSKSKSRSKGSSKPAAASVELRSWGQIKTNR